MRGGCAAQEGQGRARVAAAGGEGAGPRAEGSTLYEWCRGDGQEWFAIVSRGGHAKQAKELEQCMEIQMI